MITREDVVKNFLSYFVDCAMGGYSLDEEGFVYAGGDFHLSKYRSFKIDTYGIIPMTDEEYLNENFDFIASELKGKYSDTSRERIRNYFLNAFYKDHLKMYKKLPIYWQYDIQYAFLSK